jgi:hypothetical protein
VVAATIALPYTPLGRPFALVPLPPYFLLVLAFIVLGYILSAELANRGSTGGCGGDAPAALNRKHSSDGHRRSVGVEAVGDEGLEPPTSRM